MDPPPYEEAPVNFLGAWLLVHQRRLMKRLGRPGLIEPVTSRRERAEDELFAIFSATMYFVAAVGFGTLFLPSGLPFKIAFTVMCGIGGLLVGAGIPLQLCMWNCSIRGLPDAWYWQWGVAGVVGAASVAVAAASF